MVAPLLALLSWLGASSAPLRGDTTLRWENNPIVGGWTVDGASIRLRSMCTLSIPGSCHYRLESGGDTLSPLPGAVREVFLTIGGGCTFGPGCVVAQGNTARFDHSAGWRVKGRTGDWAMEIDSLWFRSTPAWARWDSAQASSVLVPAAQETVLRVRWTRIQPGIPWVLWTDTVRAPASPRSSGGRVDPQARIRGPLLRWLDPTAGALRAITCSRLDSIGAPRIPSGPEAPAPALRLFRRDSAHSLLDLGIGYGGEMWDWSQEARYDPSLAVSIPGGAIVDFDASMGYLGGESGIHPLDPLPSPTATSATGWERVSARWTLQLGSATDTLTVLGWFPHRWTTGVTSRPGPAPRPAGRVVDALGRTVPTFQAGHLRFRMELDAP